MWQNDTVYLQTSVDVNVYGSISRTWTKSTAVTCDVQNISKEYAFKEYGFTEATEYKQVFDHTLASWVKGDQVSLLDEQWLVRNVIDGLDKMGASNHTLVILSKVV